MSSFQTSSPDERKAIQHLSKKRIWEEQEDNFEKFKEGLKRTKMEKTKSLVDIQLQLENPLPVEWQQCLDIQSGKIHFYNTRTHRRTCNDPRGGPESTSPGPVSLDLELNLPCQSLRTHVNDNWSKPLRNSSQETKNPNGLPSMAASLEPSHRQEMVAVACVHCHTLVMLCKSSPSCPSCKFMYPIDQFKERFRLSSFKD